MKVEDIQTRILQTYGKNMYSCSAYSYKYSPNGKKQSLGLIKCLRCNDEQWKKISPFINQKKGCIKCNKNKCFDFDFVLLRFNSVHKERYDYDKNSYIGWNDKISAKCLSCKNNFYIRCSDHYKGVGCQNCYKNRKITTEVFIQRANKIHGEKYDYSNTIYKNIMEKVKIFCNTCFSEFEQTPNHHLNLKNGCTLCALELSTSKAENLWLDSLSIPKENRQIQITVDNEYYVVDALVGNNVYEFYGSYWHGDPRTTHPEQLIGSKRKLSAKELFKKTIDRQNLLQKAGYHVKFVWEYDNLAGVTFSESHPTINYRDNSYTI